MVPGFTDSATATDPIVGHATPPVWAAAPGSARAAGARPGIMIMSPLSCRSDDNGLMIMK
jgi:hypothetical protein